MISIITPTHDATYLWDLYDSIKNQPFDEWVLIPNNGCKIPDFHDDRIKIYNLDIAPKYVGALKKYGFNKAKGNILVEVDHDDVLIDGAIDKIKQAFEDESVGFVYSNSCNFRDGYLPTEKYNQIYGWQYRDFNYNGHVLNEARAFNQYPSGITKIWYAPNHVRAWRKSVYDKVGGHDENMRVLDDQDLISRTYLITNFKHIDECLYLYRVSGKNTWIEHNKEIQNNVFRLRDKYFEKVSLEWGKKNGLLNIDMGAAVNPAEGYFSCDIIPGSAYQFDASERWPFEDNSVGVIRAHDFMEHIWNKVHLINEMYRVLAHGGVVLSETPSVNGNGAFRDPTHCAYYCKESFWYYTQDKYRKYCPEIQAKFQAEYLDEVEKWNIPYIRAWLVAIKGSDLPGAYGFER